MACNPPRRVTAKPAGPARTTRPAPAPPPAPRPAAPSVQAGANTVAWLDSERLMPVLEMAQRERKPVFVEFYASWCVPCKVMEEEVFTQPEVFRYLNMNFLNFRTDFDGEAGKTIAEIYEVQALPTVLFLSPSGVVLARHTGVCNPSLLRRLGDQALGR